MKKLIGKIWLVRFMVLVLGWTYYEVQYWTLKLVGSKRAKCKLGQRMLYTGLPKHIGAGVVGRLLLLPKDGVNAQSFIDWKAAVHHEFTHLKQVRVLGVWRMFKLYASNDGLFDLELEAFRRQLGCIIRSLKHRNMADDVEGFKTFFADKVAESLSQTYNIEGAELMKIQLMRVKG